MEKPEIGGNVFTIKMESAQYINTNIPLSPDAQKDSSSQQVSMRLGCGNGVVSLYYSKGFHRKSQSTMAGEQTQATKDIQTEPVCHTSLMEPDRKTQRGIIYSEQWLVL